MQLNCFLQLNKCNPTLILNFKKFERKTQLIKQCTMLNFINKKIL